MTGVAVVAALAVFAAVTPAQAATTVLEVVNTPDNYLYSQYATAISPDGKIQAIPAYDSNAVIFVYADTHDYVTVTDTNGDVALPIDAAFSPDGKTLYVANYYDNKIVLVDVATSTVTGTITTSTDENIAVEVSPDGNTLIITNAYDAVFVYDLGTSTLSSGILTSSYMDRIVVIDDTYAYLIGYYGSVDYFNYRTGTVGPTTTTGVSPNAYGSCVSPDRSTVVWVADTTMTVGDITNVSTAQTFDLSADVTSMAQCVFTPDGSQVLVTDWSTASPGVVHVIDVATGDVIQNVDIDGVDDTDGINIMYNCEVIVDGYYQDLAFLLLDPGVCTPPGPNLPDTGASQSLTITLATVAGSLLLLGTAVVVAVRRRGRALKGGLSS